MAAKTTVTDYIAHWVSKSNKTQAQITEEAGFPKSNILSMIKMGHTKLPLQRIGPLADALECPKKELFRIVMGEYMPDVLALIEQIYDEEKLTTGERELIDRLRLQTAGKDFKLNADQKSIVDDLAKQLKKA